GGDARSTGGGSTRRWRNSYSLGDWSTYVISRPRTRLSASQISAFVRAAGPVAVRVAPDWPGSTMHRAHLGQVGRVHPCPAVPRPVAGVLIRPLDRLGGEQQV